ncbi:unnamed protein product [Pleuronectes platessa]|uniref:Uncharacterized protein n=1 Tax=Pleuronectes platessa TaxID=8262 RepID=A0A9N7U7B0_PLEPL|nr:unnamed protein product [Pleuronectes platessa]
MQSPLQRDTLRKRRRRRKRMQLGRSTLCQNHEAHHPAAVLKWPQPPHPTPPSSLLNVWPCMFDLVWTSSGVKESAHGVCSVVVELDVRGRTDAKTIELLIRSLASNGGDGTGKLLSRERAPLSMCDCLLGGSTPARSLARSGPKVMCSDVGIFRHSPPLFIPPSTPQPAQPLPIDPRWGDEVIMLVTEPDRDQLQWSSCLSNL